MKNIKNKILILLVGLGSVLLTPSCNEWTELEHVKFTDKQIPASEAYLENLRAYKNSDHKKVYGWVDNSEKSPTRRYQHYTNMPDSLDAIFVTTPELASWEVQEMNDVRSQKATKFYYTISYEAILKQHEDLVAEGKPALPDYILSQVTSQLALLSTHSYDGVAFACNAVGSANQTVFVDAAKAYIEANPDVAVFYEGACSNITDKAFLEAVDLVFVPCQSVIVEMSLVAKLTYIVINGGDVDYSSKLVAVVSAPSIDPEKKSQGQWTDSNPAQTAIDGASNSVVVDQTHYSLVGLGITNMLDDRTMTGYYFGETKKGINNINPSLKN